MGLYDREYYREEQRGFGLGEGDVVPKLIAINAVLLLADQLFLNGRLDQWFGLRTDLWTHPWNVFQVLTYGFLHADVMHVLFNMLALFFFGREIEGIYGRSEFLRLYLSLIAVAGLGWLVVEAATDPGRMAVLVGASGAVSGICVLFALHYPRRMIYIWGIVPVPAWLLVSLYLLQDVSGAMAAAQGSPRGGNVAYVAHLAGAAAAFAYFRTGWSLGRLWPERLRLPLGRGNWLGKRPQLRVHRPGTEPDGREEIDLSREVDRLLEKISTTGEASLSAEERRTLESASRRYQERRR